MKKFCFVAVLTVLVFAVALPCFASADVASVGDDAAQHNATFRRTYMGADGKSYVKYTLTSVADQNGNVYGVRFSGYYFGSSGIEVQVELYSSETLALDFYFGDEDYVAESQREASACYLTEAQTAVRTQIVELFDAVDALVDAVDECANTQYDGSGTLPVSDIYRYNAASCGETLQISRETYEMLTVAREMYSATDGAFNPAVYRLVDLWGFSSRIYSNGAFDTEKYPYDRPVTSAEFAQNGYPLPDQKYIDAFSDENFTDFSDAAVHFYEESGKYYVVKNVSAAVVDGVSFEQWLDLGGIAKGYAVDEIKALLEQGGIMRYYVDAGSSSSAYGQSASGGANTLQLADPNSELAQILPEVLLGYEVGSCAVSTSGQYVRNYTVDGVEYSHIIDGSTGAPAQTGVRLVSVSVSEGTEGDFWAARSDCLTTALTVMGKEKIVEFVNGYLKENNITVVVVFETFDGKKEIVSNLDKDKIEVEGENFDEYAWTLIQDADGSYVYDGSETFSVRTNKIYKTVGIVLACILGACVVGVIVFRLVKGSKKSAIQNVRLAHSERPFKFADLGVYLSVALLIAVLFGAFLGGGSETNAVQMVEAYDIQTGEQLFFYNVVRNEYKANNQSTNGWEVTVEEVADGIEVTFSREIDGEIHFNLLKITLGTTVSAEMTDAVCGFRRDCVNTFGAADEAGEVIVCSPNRLKIVTE